MCHYKLFHHFETRNGLARKNNHRQLICWMGFKPAKIFWMICYLGPLLFSLTCKRLKYWSPMSRKIMAIRALRVRKFLFAIGWDSNPDLTTTTCYDQPLRWTLPFTLDICETCFPLFLLFKMKFLWLQHTLFGIIFLQAWILILILCNLISLSKSECSCYLIITFWWVLTVNYGLFVSSLLHSSPFDKSNIAMLIAILFKFWMKIDSCGWSSWK